MPAEDAVHSEKLENVCVFIVGFVHEPCNFFLVTSLDFIKSYIFFFITFKNLLIKLVFERPSVKRR